MGEAMKSIKRFFRDDSGVTSMEYALIAVLIAVAIVAGAALVGVGVSALFTIIGNAPI
jgi:pilus assembly protein Flp/PilA